MSVNLSAIVLVRAQQYRKDVRPKVQKACNACKSGTVPFISLDPQAIGSVSRKTEWLEDPENSCSRKVLQNTTADHSYLIGFDWYDFICEKLNGEIKINVLCCNCSAMKALYNTLMSTIRIRP